MHHSEERIGTEESILIVDDAPENLRLLSEVLRGAGYRVRPAPGGRIALRSVAAVPPTLILLDIRMPEMDGYEVCRRLKADPETRDIPVIFISALDDTRDKIEAFKAGGVDYVNKPFHAEEVLARVKVHLDLCRVRGQLEARNRRLQQEIEEHRLAREALAAGEEKIRAMSNASHDALAMIDGTGIISFWNPAAEKMFGYSREEALGQEIHSLIAMEEDRGPAREGLKGFAETGQGKVVGNVMDFMARKKGGEIFPVERSVASFRVQGKWYAVGSVRDITERRQAETRLRELATTDSLTGVLNRREFLRLGDLEFDRSRRYDRYLSLLMVDADRFKGINDTYGHAAGDRVLKTFADIGRHLLRESDLFGRIGGEEFAILLPETDHRTAMEVADRLCRAVEAATLTTESGDITFTVSIGVAGRSPDTGSAHEMMKRADAALYRAKTRGRNRVEKG